MDITTEGAMDNGNGSAILDDDYLNYTAYKTSVLLWIYFPPVLIVFGTIGNVLSIIVMYQPSMRQSTTSLYLRILAVMDLIVLYTGLLRHWLLYLIDTDIRTISEPICKLHTWILYFSIHSSAWLLVAVTLERVLSVTFPHMMKMRCTRKVAYAVIATILVFFLLINAHYLYGLGEVYTKEDNNTISHQWECEGITNEYSEFEGDIWPWMDYCLYSLFPSTILVVSNFCIIRKVFVSDRKAIVGSGGYSGDVKARKSQTSSLTTTLVVISAMFVICTTPFCVYIIYTKGYESTDSATRATEELAWALVNLLQYTNNAINFILYSLTGSRFRYAVRSLFCKQTLAPRSTIYTTQTFRHSRTSDTGSRTSETGSRTSDTGSSGGVTTDQSDGLASPKHTFAKFVSQTTVHI